MRHETPRLLLVLWLNSSVYSAKSEGSLCLYSFSLQCGVIKAEPVGEQFKWGWGTKVAIRYFCMGWQQMISACKGDAGGDTHQQWAALPVSHSPALPNVCPHGSFALSLGNDAMWLCFLLGTACRGICRTQRMKKVIRFCFSLLWDDSNMVVFLSLLISGKYTCLSQLHVKAVGCLQFLHKTTSFKAVFFLHTAMIKNRSH